MQYVMNFWDESLYSTNIGYFTNMWSFNIRWRSLDTIDEENIEVKCNI